MGSGWDHAGLCAYTWLLRQGNFALNMSDLSVHRRRGHIWASRSSAAHASVSGDELRKRSSGQGPTSAPACAFST